jgi:GTP diphosphokinase / guanosine-3',5'-bis(diphosphate) 3'-diphosphatase
VQLRENDTAGRNLVSDAQALFSDLVHDPLVARHIHEMHNLLNQWQARTPVLTAAWLLLLVKHELVSDQELTTRFGSRALTLARLATKIIFIDANPENIKRNSSKATYTQLTKYLFLCAYQDFEVVLVVVADQIATIMQYDHMNEADRQEWAQRNQTVFLPLLEMLGLWKHSTELGNISLYILNPSQFEQLDKRVGVYRDQHQQLYNSIAPILMGLLEKYNLKNSNISLHLTSPSSLYKRIEKLKRRGELPKTNDIGALCIDVLVEDELDCYTALGVIHNCWKPALRHSNRHLLEPDSESRFYDYIASPRYNGYRCLLTTVLCDIPSGQKNQEKPNRQLVEFRIRTYAMEEINSYGIAAAILDPSPIRNAWWTHTTLRELMKPGNTDFVKQKMEIAVLTPNGEVIYPLPTGCTMIDFAFKLHSDTGAYAKVFWVNGKTVSAEYELRHRDLVEIEYDLHHPTIKPEWEEIAKIPSTKGAIRRFFKQRERAPQRGRQLLDEVLKRELAIYEMQLAEEKIENSLANIARELHCASLEMLYLRIAEGVISPDEVVNTIFEKELAGHIVPASGEELPSERVFIAQTWMQEKEPQKWSRHSRVLPGVEIVGKLTGNEQARTLTVYRKDSKFAPKNENAIPLRWRSSEDNREVVEISVIAPPRSHVIGMVFHAIYDIGKDNEKNRVSIHHFNAQMNEGQLVIKILIDAPSENALHMIQDALKITQRSGYITEFKIWQLFPGYRNLIISRSDKRQHNPYTLKQVRNRKMFYGRQEELKRILQNIEEGHLVVLYGQKRIGKTSLLNQLADNLLAQHQDFFPVTFDVLGLSPFNTSTFLTGLAEATLEKLQKPEDRKGLKYRQRDFQEEPFKAFAEWVKRVQTRLQGKRLVFLVDEFTRAEEECQRGNIQSTFFDGLQWLTGAQNISFVLCVHDHIMAREDNKSWGLLQRGTPVRLDHLDRASAERLIQQPLENIYKLEPELINRIVSLTDCHPYLIHVICHTLISQMSHIEYNYVTSNDLDVTLIEVLENAEHYFSHLSSRVSKQDWEILKIIAYITDQERVWATSEAIRSELKRHGYKVERMQIAKSIGDLRHAGIIEAKEAHNHAMYRIPIGLLHIWLRQKATNLLVSRDLQTEDE